jgi:hemoglobin
LVVLATSASTGVGCAQETKKDPDFFTSGSRQADQRAEQQVAKVQQLRGEGTGGEDAKDVKAPLYERIGGEQGVNAIVEDFVNRAIADPRVNWERKGVTYGGMLGIKQKSAEWTPDPGSVARVKKHLAQFLALSTGGPVKYEGKEMKGAHQNMKITNAEFDASVGDLKATLERLGVAVQEQKEVLAIVESTRPQIVEQR